MDGVKFNEDHSSTWGLFLNSTDISKPKPKMNYVDIPYGDGSADLTEAMGEIKYSMRGITLTFLYPSSTVNFEALATTLTNLLQGKKVKITLDKDPNYYYYGRCEIDYKKSDILGTIVINAVCDPYKYKVAVTTETYAVTTTRDVVITNGRMTAYPLITTSAAFNITVDGTVYSYAAVTDYQTAIPFLEGDTPVTMAGTGNVTFTWQEGAL